MKTVTAWGESHNFQRTRFRVSRRATIFGADGEPITLVEEYRDPKSGRVVNFRSAADAQTKAAELNAAL